MIVFKKLTFANILSVGNIPVSIELDKVKTTLIHGTNGTGKSTILDALTYSLFGKPFRRINLPQLLNSQNNKNLLTEIEFTIGKNEFRVVRGMKPKVFEIWKNGEIIENKAADKVGFYHVNINLEDTISEDALMEEVNKLNNDDRIHGILVQLPLPKHIDAEKILRNIKVSKDADGFSALNIGNMCLRGGLEPMAIPCTPAGCIELLKRSNIEVSGKNAVVLGRSNIVGMPVAHLLQQMSATVTVCHSRTKNPQQFIKQADIIVAAIGKAEYVRGDWLEPGCVVIDVGINSVDAPDTKRGYRLVGDVNYAEAKEVVEWITPVPGGVGPMTIAMLLRNTWNSWRRATGAD